MDLCLHRKKGNNPTIHAKRDAVNTGPGLYLPRPGSPLTNQLLICS